MRNEKTYNCNECYSGFYLNAVQNQCLVTNPLCRTVTSENKCTSCFEGYVLVKEECLSSLIYNSNNLNFVNMGNKQNRTETNTTSATSSATITTTTATSTYFDLNCRIASEKKCLSCYSGSFYN